MKTNLSILFGIFFLISALLDLIFGDPRGLVHPVEVMGKLIHWEEKLGRSRIKSPRGLRAWGLAMVIFNVAVAFAVPALILALLPPVLGLIFSIYVAWTSLSAKTLVEEADKVARALEESLEAGRHRLSYIVGRDTRELSREEILRATVETVAENTSDGIIAPLLYLALLGPAGGWAYKMINTMDSMIAYRNDKYVDLGRAAAIVDDVANFIPARLTGLLMVLLSPGSWGEGLRILRRDARAHLSPNSGFPESALAGILGIQLGGGHFYFGKFVEKPTIGDDIRKIEPEDIKRTNQILWRVSSLGVILAQLLFNFIYV
ncbi:MAG: adenosylcobinamide-phosphate synthase CbiB [Tissierellia bacterium]|nr:adenosylcobinamide-phosphate synthase CbiB [Tissierellia bacterium]